MDTVQVSDFSHNSRFFSWFTWNRVIILLGLCLIFFLAIDFSSFAFDDFKSSGQNIDDPSTWDIGKNGVFSLVFLYFQKKCIAAQNNLRPIALSLSCFFMMIQIATTWTLYEGQIRFFELIKEVLRFSFLLFLIINSKMLTDTFIQGFQFFGAVGSGLFSIAKASDQIEAIANNEYFDPSKFIDMGWQAVGKMTSVNGAGPVDKLILFLCAVVGYLGTVFIGLQITITSVEFYLFTGLGVILIPFGILRYTSFLFQKVISGIFSFGIRMMVVYFMAGLAYSVLQDFKGKFDAGASPSFDIIFNCVLLYAVVGYLVWKIPVIVQGMISGTPQMDGGSMATAAKGAAFGTAAGAARFGGRVAGTWAKNKKSKDGSANKPGPEDTKDAANANAVSGNGSNNGAMAGGGDEMGPAAKEAQANYQASQSEGGSSGSEGGSSEAVENASQTSNTPEQAAGGASGASGGAGGSGQMSHGDKAWNAAASKIASTKAGLKQYGNQVKADFKQSVSDGAKGAMEGASNLAKSAGGAINSAGHKAFGSSYDKAVSQIASGLSKGKAIASDWTPTPVKQAPRKLANQVKDSFKKGSHLRNFASDMGHQAFVNLPGVKQFYDGAYHAGRDTSTYDNGVSGSLKEYVNNSYKKPQDPTGPHD